MTDSQKKIIAKDCYNCFTDITDRSKIAFGAFDLRAGTVLQNVVDKTIEISNQSEQNRMDTKNGLIAMKDDYIIHIAEQEVKVDELKQSLIKFAIYFFSFLAFVITMLSGVVAWNSAITRESNIEVIKNSIKFDEQRILLNKKADRDSILYLSQRRHLQKINNAYYDKRYLLNPKLNPYEELNYENEIEWQFKR